MHNKQQMSYNFSLFLLSHIKQLSHKSHESTQINEIFADLWNLWDKIMQFIAITPPTSWTSPKTGEE